MKEQVGITVPKKGDFAQWYTEVVLKAGLADYAPVKGLIVLRPDGYSIWEMLQRTFDARFAGRGIRNGFLPVLIPESLLGREKEHFEGFNPEVFWVTHSGEHEVGDRLALRPTSETLAYTMYSKWIKSWRDLPLKINFWNTALRAEIKATKPFLRTSEFLWQEGHTVHATAKEAEEEVAAILEIYRGTIEDELAIPVISGRKSEREKFVGAEYTTAVESIMPDGKALQMGTSHFLGQNFSRPFEVRFADRDNIEHDAWQTSWGVSWRLIGAMIMTHGDDRGLVLPPRVAPLQVVIVPIYYSDEEQERVISVARDIREDLASRNLRVHMDERPEMTPGFKFHDWELRGVPLRLEVGPKDIAKKSVTTARRHDGSKSALAISEISRVPHILDEIQSEMLERARAIMAEQTHRIPEYKEFKNQIKKGGFVLSPWCGAAECEEKIKDETGAEIRVVPFDSAEGGSGCLVCDKRPSRDAVFARGY